MGIADRKNPWESIEKFHDCDHSIDKVPNIDGSIGQVCKKCFRIFGNLYVPPTKEQGKGKS